jgi:hypothetical protein
MLIFACPPQPRVANFPQIEMRCFHNQESTQQLPPPRCVRPPNNRQPHATICDITGTLTSTPLSNGTLNTIALTGEWCFKNGPASLHFQGQCSKARCVPLTSRWYTQRQSNRSTCPFWLLPTACCCACNSVLLTAAAAAMQCTLVLHAPTTTALRGWIMQSMRPTATAPRLMKQLNSGGMEGSPEGAQSSIGAVV